MKLSACGRICSERYCDAFNVHCKGCYHTRIDELQKPEEDMCPIYECIKFKKNINNCGMCNEIPCENWNICVDNRKTKTEQNEDKIIRLKRLGKCPTTGSS